MQNTTAPVDRDTIAIDDALVDLSARLGALSFPDWSAEEIMRGALLAGVRGATMHLHLGRLERAASIVDAIREDIHQIER